MTTDYLNTCQAYTPRRNPRDHQAEYFVAIEHDGVEGVTIPMCGRHAHEVRDRFERDATRKVIVTPRRPQAGEEPSVPADTPEPDLDRRLSIAMRLLAMTETELASEATDLRQRITDALEYMDDVSSPNTHTLNHIRRYLNGSYEPVSVRDGGYAAQVTPDESGSDHLNTEALYIQVMELVVSAIAAPDKFNLTDLRRALDPILAYGKIIGRRGALRESGRAADGDRLIEDWTKIAEADVT